MIPVADPVIAKNAQRYLKTCLESKWISGAGPFVARFEKEFARFIGTRYGVACTSGTAALHLALASLALGPGDEVIVPAFTMIATILPVLYLGATPVLVDAEPDTGNLDLGQVKKKITLKTRAIIPVHINGHPVDIPALIALTKAYRIKVVEDAAEAHGAAIQMSNDKFQMTNDEAKRPKKPKSASVPVRTKWQRVGSFGDLGCFSFYANKIVTTGEGGMVTTNNSELAKRLVGLRNLARTPSKHFFHRKIAFNYRMSNLQAALGVAQLEEVDWAIQKKRTIARLYQQELSEIPYLTLPSEKPYAKNVYWQYGILLNADSPVSRDQLAVALERRGIETRIFFVPLNKQPVFKKLGLFKGESYPVAENLGKRGLNLPSGLALSQRQISLVCEVIRQAFL